MMIEKEDKVISEFLAALGPWKEYVVIGGGYAPIIYKLYLTDKKLQNFPVGTRDIDSLLPRKIPEVSKKNIPKYLSEAGFTHVFKNLDMPATEAYFKEIDGIEIEVEFLTDSATRNNKDKNVVIGGVVAQPLSYLTLSLQRTLPFQTHSNSLGRVVSPGAWIFHKGLTFPRRKISFKMFKDLYGIWYVASQLGNFSKQAMDEFAGLSGYHSKWFKTFKNNMHHLLKNASPDEWALLETQDPSGRLKKLHFQRVLRQLLEESGI